MGNVVAVNAGGDDVNIMIIIIFRKLSIADLALREESWASYLGSRWLLDCGVCRSPFLIAEGVAATTMGIDK